MNNVMIQVLRHVVSKKVKPYYANHDAGHSITHADDVVNDGINIIKYLNKPELIGDVIVAGYLHDIGLSYGRDTHHIYAGRMLQVTGELNMWFEKLCWTYELNMLNIINACMEHRSTFKGTFSSLLSEIISAADRGKPNLHRTITRSIKYTTINHPDWSETKIVENVVGHVRTKFGRHSKRVFPDIWKRCYAQDLECFYLCLDDPSTVRTLVATTMKNM